MERIDFNTGRFYSTKGQEITAVKIDSDILMIDHTRMLSYMIPNCPLQVISIMARYDKNYTEMPETQDLRNLSYEIQGGYDNIIFEKIEV